MRLISYAEIKRVESDYTCSGDVSKSVNIQQIYSTTCCFTGGRVYELRHRIAKLLLQNYFVFKFFFSTNGQFLLLYVTTIMLSWW